MWETIDAIFTWLAARGPAFTAVSAATGAVIAVLGYRKWHPETTGKRKIELAEEILAGNLSGPPYLYVCA